MTVAAKPRLAYRPELDGLRAVAVVAVMCRHLGQLMPPHFRFATGGFLGVDVFFVLSGMLITELLVSEQLAHGTVSLRGFYRRRAQRLLPALAALLALAVGYDQLVHGTGIATLKGLESISSYTTFGHLTGGSVATPVEQVWTLVVEWEFYLIWPIVLAVLLRLGVGTRTLAYGAIAAAVAIAVAGAVLYHGDHNSFLGFYLAWRRFQELLIGCAVGLLGARPQLPNWMRTMAFGAILAVMVLTRFTTHWLYLGGMLAIAVATAAIVAPRATPWSIDRFLSSRPMVWIGKLSYSLYLWSVPVILEIGRSTSWPRPVKVVVAIVGSFALASASYYLIERRFRLPSRGALSGPGTVTTTAATRATESVAAAAAVEPQAPEPPALRKQTTPHSDRVGPAR